MVYNEASDVSKPRQGLSLRDIPAHDPYVLAQEETGTYYLYTGGSPRLHGLDRYGVLVYKSKDLSDWEGPYVVFTVPDGVWANPQHGAWAPEVHLYRGRYYLFVTLHNNDRGMEAAGSLPLPVHWRGTVIACADSPMGPFRLLDTEKPVTPPDRMALDGSLHLDEGGRPWMVYCHEWIQIRDGSIEAIPLMEDLSGADGEPVHLFHASEAGWDTGETHPGVEGKIYVTDGCQLYRTGGGSLYMLWSSYDRGQYVQTAALSRSGRLQGPWEQLEPHVREDSGHGMFFRTFGGEWMLILHRPFRMPDSRCKLYDMEETEDGFRVAAERADLHG